MFYKNMVKLQKQYHQECLFNSGIFDLQLSFTKTGELIAHFDCTKKYQGYLGRVHGGVLSGIMDAAMNLFLFGHNIVAYTVRLHIKYSRPVLLGKTAIVKVLGFEIQNGFLYKVQGSISQDNKKLVSAKATFWRVRNGNV
jgi:acyl-coenzyme A thioesterase PaaI-like protein